MPATSTPSRASLHSAADPKAPRPTTTTSLRITSIAADPTTRPFLVHRHARLLAGRQIGLFHLVCYLRDSEHVFETYWTTRRGAEAIAQWSRVEAGRCDDLAVRP